MAPIFFSQRRSDATCSLSDSSCSPPNSDTTSGTDPSGARRFIGIGMVLGLLFIVFLAWLYYGKWPRTILRQYCCCCSKRSNQLPKSNISSTPGDSDKGLDKEVSGGMLVFTQVPKVLGKKDRHINDIRLEVGIPASSAHLLHVLIDYVR